MTSNKFMKGNEALAYGALMSGLNAYFAYPITPSSEIPETLAREFRSPEHPAFRAYLQTSSEIEAINMVIGASSTGARTMTATSGPGFSLMQEGLSYAAAMELPFVVVDVNRAGPGLGNLGPEQSDYFQATKGGGHGGYRNIVLAPSSVQEMASLPSLGFSLAFKHRNPVIILADAFLGQIKEDIEFPELIPEQLDTGWATTGATSEQRHLLLSLHLDFEDQARHTEQLERKYAEIQRTEARSEEYMTDDAEIVLVSYGIVSRLCRHVVNQMRKQGVKVGLFRPVTLSPFPSARLGNLADDGKKFVVVELNMGQMLEDVRLAVEESTRVGFANKLGGLLPSSKEIAEKVEMMRVGN